MPKIEIYKSDLDALCRHRFTAGELERALAAAKAEIEQRNSSGKIKLDCKDTNRPDLWCVEGIARMLRGVLGIETGLPRYRVHKGAVVLNVDRAVERVRPAIVGAIVRGLKFNDRTIEQTIQLQEKVSLSYGRARAAAAIGIYDWSKIVPPIRYTTFKSDQIAFVPLGFERKMCPKEILAEHPKGKEFGHLIPGEDFPILIDSVGNVLSMPPIINSALTGKITEATQDVFVEVTGSSLRLISTCLNVIVSALAERGGLIEAITIAYPKSKIIRPDMTERKMVIDPGQCRAVLGLAISDQEIVKLLRAARYDAVLKGKKIVCTWPAWRDDIMHSRDIIEDVAIAFGYNELQPLEPQLPTIGKEIDIERFCHTVKEICIGMGLQEVLTFILTNQDSQFKKMCMSTQPVAAIANPVSARWTCLRSWLLPCLLEFLAKNTHIECPQEVFEVGDCIVLDERAETRAVEVRKLGIVATDSTIGYERIASLTGALLLALGLEYKIIPTEHPSFISGRVGKIVVGSTELGILGEIHPNVLNNWGIERPVVGAELELTKIYKK